MWRKSVVLGLIVFAFVAATVSVHYQHLVAASTGPDVGPDVANFASINQAQALVPFRIQQPAAPDGFSLVGVSVVTRRVVGQQQAATRVQLDYRSPEHELISLTESEMSFTVVIPNGRQQTAVVNDGPAEAISGQNQAGTSVGAVTWQVSGLTFALEASDTDGPSIVPLANSVR